jgi:hypothetical protein
MELNWQDYRAVNAEAKGSFIFLVSLEEQLAKL